jgi:alpha-1,2-mannosyltransferase
VDLHVYRMGGDAVLHDTPLYGLRYAGQLPFTYPPFAALVFTSLAWLPWGASATLITAATVVALPVLLYLELRLPPSPLIYVIIGLAALVIAAAGELSAGGGPFPWRNSRRVPPPMP